MTIDLLVGSILFEQTSQDTQSTDPQNLYRHTSIGGTLSLSGSCVSSLTPGFGILPDPGSRVNGNRLPDDESILHQFPDMLSRVGVADFVSFIRVQPDFVLSALQDSRCQPFLQPEGTDKTTLVLFTRRPTIKRLLTARIGSMLR